MFKFVTAHITPELQLNNAYTHELNRKMIPLVCVCVCAEASHLPYRYENYVFPLIQLSATIPMGLFPKMTHLYSVCIVQLGKKKDIIYTFSKTLGKSMHLYQFLNST